MARNRASMREGPLAELFRATEAALAEEGIWMGRLLLRVFPQEPEAMGLAALMLLQQARAPARPPAAPQAQKRWRSLPRITTTALGWRISSS